MLSEPLPGALTAVMLSLGMGGGGVEGGVCDTQVRASSALLQDSPCKKDLFYVSSAN